MKSNPNSPSFLFFLKAIIFFDHKPFPIVLIILIFKLFKLKLLISMPNSFEKPLKYGFFVKNKENSSVDFLRSFATKKIFLI